MSQSASKKTIKKEPSQDKIDGRTKEGNLNRLKSVFEIRRPNRTPSFTLRKSKSTSVLTVAQNSDDDELKANNDRAFVRNSGARCGIRSSYKHKRDRINSSEHDNTKSDMGDIGKNTMAEEFIKRTRKQIQTKHNAPENFDIALDKNHLEKFSEVQRKLNEIFLIANQNKCSLEGEYSKSSTMERKFAKNDNKPTKTKTHYYTLNSFESNSSTSSNKSSKELITQKQTKERRKRIKSFVEAECEGETETYRQSLVLEMDLEVAKMKMDGFIDEDENPPPPEVDVEADNARFSKVGRYKQFFEGMFHELDENIEILQNEYESKTTEGLGKQNVDEQQQQNYSEQAELSDSVENLSDIEGAYVILPPEHTHDTSDDIAQKPERNLEDEFCESLGDDLEHGSFFVEAYNDDGRELAIVEISIERRTVNFDRPFSMESIQNSFKNADMVFHENADKSLNVINDPKELVNENAGLVSYGPHSNRSTLYSTTSRDSDIFDTDDEGIGMGNIEQRNHEDDAYNNSRRETFCDHKGIVRIERIGYPESVHGTSFQEEPQSPVSRTQSFAQKGTLSYIIDEIKSTERKYVDDLQKVVQKYAIYIDRHTPPNLIGKNCSIFGNIHTLLHYQQQFLDVLMNCGDEVDEVLKTFIEFEHLFQLYPTYFKNKPKADVVLREFSPIVKRAQEKFKERLDLSAYLLTPLQRLGKYKLFLENIEKQLEKIGLPTASATIALDIIKREMSKGNDFVAIESIEHSPIDKSEYGSFKMREKFNIIKPRRFEAMVFLFENIIVFTLNNQNNVENYLYHDSIRMNDLRIATFEDLTLHLTDFTKCKKLSKLDKFTYILEAKTEKIKDIWRKTIEDMLWQQLLKVKENTLKMYQGKSTKRGKISRNRIKTAGASTFYVTI